MFESRRTFLQELLAAAGALGLDPLQGVATEGDEYSNARLALRLRRPPGWDFSSVADFAALRDQQVLIDSVDGEVHPLKDPRRTGTFRVLQEPVSIQLQGARGTWSHWYLHELDNGTSHQLIVRSLVVFREPRVHTFHYVELPGSRRRPESTWENFLGSISYELARRDPRVRRDSRRITRKIDRAAVAAEPHLVWNAFVDLCAMEDYAELSATQRLGQLVFWYDSEVQNGGHLQYFVNRGTDLLASTSVCRRSSRGSSATWKCTATSTWS